MRATRLLLPVKRCPSCGATFDVAAGFCPNDGSALLATGAPSHQYVPDNTPRRVVGGAAAEPSGAWHAAPPSAEATSPVFDTESHMPGVRFDEDGEEVLLGTVLAERYRIDQRIGAGGMGVVYQAVHTGIDKPVAIKVLRSEYAQVEDVAKRFELEARVASKINHPNVVDINDYGYTPGQSPYYVMELLDGVNLGDLIDDHGPMDPQRAIDVARGLAFGLGAAHAHGIVHRDLKPDNIVLMQQNGVEVPKILDFGIARVKTKRTRLTAAGSVVGTPEYMSPEQAQGKEVDARADIYSLGAILFEMLTGTVPLRGATLVETLTMQVYDTPPRLSEVAPMLTDYPALEELVARTLAKDMDERPATASQFADALANALPKELGKASESSERLKATVAMGSWSVGNQPSPEMPTGAGAGHRGPILNQGVPAPMGFSPTPPPALATPVAAPEPEPAPVAAAAPVPAAAPQAAAAIAYGPPPGSGSGVSGYGYGHGSGLTHRPTRQMRRRSKTNWPVVILVGALGSVGVGFGVVALFQTLGQSGTASAAASDERGALEQAGADAATESTQDPVPPAVAPTAATGSTAGTGAAAGGTGPASATGAAATGEAGAIAATATSGSADSAAGTATPKKTTKKSTKTKKKKKKAASSVPALPPPDKSVVTTTEPTTGGGAQDTKPKEPEKPKDPPPDPGVSLGDLRDPFG